MGIQHPNAARVPRVDDEKCRACRKCPARKVCRVKALVVLDPGESPFVDANLCYGCLVCIPACPFEAIATAET